MVSFNPRCSFSSFTLMYRYWGSLSFLIRNLALPKVVIFWVLQFSGACQGLPGFGWVLYMTYQFSHQPLNSQSSETPFCEWVGLDIMIRAGSRNMQSWDKYGALVGLKLQMGSESVGLKISTCWNNTVWMCLNSWLSNIIKRSRVARFHNWIILLGGTCVNRIVEQQYLGNNAQAPTILLLMNHIRPLRHPCLSLRTLPIHLFFHVC